MNRSNHARIAEIIILILSLILFAGIRSMFSACGPKDDGSFMTCHWAEQAVKAFSAAMLLQSAILFFYRGRGMHGVKTGLCLALVIQSAVCALLPGHMIRLCMMDTMRCHTVMRPAVLVCCTLLALAALAGCVLNGKQCGAHHGPHGAHGDTHEKTEGQSSL